MQNQTAQTPPYAAPRLTPVGSLETMTQGQSTGGKTDAFFPTGTPRGSITFS